jgi:hypothetical protein
VLVFTHAAQPGFYCDKDTIFSSDVPIKKALQLKKTAEGLFHVLFHR